MCGIAGIIHRDLGTAVDEPLRRMQRALRHRGPDDDGLVVFPGLGGGFAHTRLSVLDLSPAGHQPMATPDGRFTISFNGEIYNFRELRAELAGDGVSFRSESDTEVILRLYEKMGPACVYKFRGMFAFAIWDAREQMCFLARDPLGIKPLYFHHTRDSLVFASEVRAVLASALVPRELSPAAVFGFFQTGSVPEPETLVQGIRCLPAGYHLLWQAGELRMQRFWSWQFASGAMDEETAVAKTREALLDSVRRHFVSDVPVGIFLSGGIDSTALVALARHGSQAPLRTFSISLDDPAMSEGDAAQRTADHFGTEHADLRLDSATGQRLFHDFLGCLDQPSVDGFNTYTISKFASEKGMKVVLSGVGGDELFGGYPSFQRVPRMVRWSQRMEPFKNLRSRLGRLMEMGSSQPRLRRLGSFLRQTPTTRAAFQTYRGIYSPAEARSLAAAFSQAGSELVMEPASEDSAQPTLQDEVSELEIETYMRNQLLRDSDVMSMAWGLELRVPLVDRPLLEALARIPAAIRLRAGKRLFLQAVPEIPAWVTSAPKRGFAFPFEQWLAGGWQETLNTPARRGQVRVQTWYQKWSLVVLTHWCAEMKIAHG